jgi:fructose-1,6-bisphosphatase I
MMTDATLDAFLDAHAQSGLVSAIDVADTVRALADAAITMRAVVNEGALGAAFAGARGAVNPSGETQKDLDVHADTIFLEAMRGVPVALYGSEELENPVLLDARGKFAVAIDPLDGSSNIDTNSSIGSIFSVLPVDDDPREDPVRPFLQSGRNQLAAGFFIYGPQLALALSLGSGTHIFVFSTRRGMFMQAYTNIGIAPRAHEFAINTSNYRHWNEPVRLYIDDCLKGTEGPRKRDFNMRWNASMVAEVYRVLMRGGIYLYPADHRKGRSKGLLRLVYEANPVALLIEQAGGGATDVTTPILDLVPESLHQRTPLVFGSSEEVALVARYHTEPSLIGDRSPLFGNRGLFRA